MPAAAAGAVLGLGLVSFVVLVAILSPLIAPYAANDQSAMMNFGSRSGPSLAHPFGTDRMGYDVLTRIVYGAPTALAVGLGEAESVRASGGGGAAETARRSSL